MLTDRSLLQVKRAGPRPPDVFQDAKPAVAKVEHVPFGQGPRIYVGGVHECLTETRLREHFTRWGSILDIYFPGARGQKRSNYCFVTFDNRRNAERACSESGRNLDGWVGASWQHSHAYTCCSQFLQNADTPLPYVVLEARPLVLLFLQHARHCSHFDNSSMHETHICCTPAGCCACCCSHCATAAVDNSLNIALLPSLLLQSLESICMADDRKVEPDHSAIASLPLPHPIVTTAADMAGRPSYTLWLQLQYQQQLAALQSTTSAAAAREAFQATQKTPSSQVSFPTSSFHAHPALEVPSDPYAQSASLYNQLQQQALGLPPQWWLPAVSGAEPAGVGSPGQEALGRPPPIMAIPAGANRDHYAMLAEQSIAYAAEHERQQQQIAARLQAIAAGVGFSPAEMEAGPRLPLLRDPAVGFGRGTPRFPGEM